MSECLVFFAGLLTPTIGIITVYIAYQQKKINQTREEINIKRLKHELYEKRFAIYDSARNFLRKITLGKVTNEMIADYYTGTNAAHFLLNDDLTKFLESIVNKAIDLQTKQIEAKDNLPKGAQERGEIKKWMYSQIKTLNEKFTTHLKLSD